MLQEIRFVAISVLLLAQTTLPVIANNLNATVVSVADGDTIQIPDLGSIRSDLAG